MTLTPRLQTAASAVELIALPGIPGVRPGDDLAALILVGLREAHIELRRGDILVVAQKVVSKAENRYRWLADVVPSARALEIAAVVDKDPRAVEVILEESRAVLRQVPGVLIVEHRLGFVMANAGVDASNIEHQAVEGARLLLLPEDPDGSAAKLAETLGQRTGVTPGLVINDSVGRAWRNGTVGVTIGLSGMPGLVDMRGEPDLFDYHLRATLVGAADELAAAASLMMGQAAEGTPVVHVRGFPYPLREGSLQELIRPKELDLFR